MFQPPFILVSLFLKAFLMVASQTQRNCPDLWLSRLSFSLTVAHENLIFAVKWWYQHSSYLSAHVFLYTWAYLGEWVGGGYISGAQEGFPWASDRKKNGDENNKWRKITGNRAEVQNSDRVCCWCKDDVGKWNIFFKQIHVDLGSRCVCVCVLAIQLNLEITLH